MKALRRAAVAGGSAALLVLGAAGPAWAHPAKPVITGPRGTQGQAANTIEATVDPGHSTLTSASVSITRVGSSAKPVVVSTTPGPSMRFGVTLSLNGTYRATVSVGWEDPSLPFVRPETGTTSSDPHEFKVAAPPARPTGVAAAVDDASREVTVRWEKNGEADMRRYEVRRSHNGGDFARAGFVDHPDTSFVDASTAGAGGDYRYIVVAYRAGVDSAVGSQVASDPSPASTAKVPDPPPPPTTAPAAPETAVAGDQSTPATTAAGTATTTTAAGTSPGSIATPGRVDLGGFDNVRSRTPRPATPRTVSLPDPGFQGTLPFDVPAGGEGGEAVEGGDVGELAADDPDVRELGEEDASADRQRSLALFAGGLLATVLLMHVLWVKGEVKRVPLEAVAPEGPPPAGRDPRPGRAGPGKAAAGAAKAARAGRPATAEWFVPDLGVDDGADRARATSGAERKAS
ncbi:MAG: hypothetical protein ACLGIO_11620 [Acidimicrobiia bacterium]